MIDPITDYLDAYKFRGDDGDYMPTPDERLVIEDAMRGYESEQVADLARRLAQSEAARYVPGESLEGLRG